MLYCGGTTITPLQQPVKSMQIPGNKQLGSG